VWIVALALGCALRLLPITAARPYMSYVDEGNFLHPAFILVGQGGWDPKTYLYPQLPILAVKAAARVVEPIYTAVSGRPFRDRIPATPGLYDDLEPFVLLVIARCLSVGLGLAIVVLTGLLAARLAGPEAGAAAALLAAVTPALVLRGSIASVDSYAAFFVLACAFLTDLGRTSPRPRLVALAAGAAAGMAFASKYPAGLVIVAFGISTTLLPIAPLEKVRRLTLAALGVAAGAAAGMPVLVVHPVRILDAIRVQATLYAHLTSPPLWKQAFLRAEWDLAYERPELGVVFVILALAGLLLGLRSRDTASTHGGWAAFLVVCLFFYGRETFQPFRNLVPLVPFGCITVVLLYGTLRRRVPKPYWIDAAAVLWLAVAFVAPLGLYAKSRLDFTDSRTRAVDWIVSHVRPDDRVLVVAEIGILPRELDRLSGTAAVRWWEAAQGEIRAQRPRFVVAGVFERKDGPPVDVAALPWVLAEYAVVFGTGTASTPASGQLWRGNGQQVLVLERKAP
jgi:Dolichyl-phosphate-mannose-protein mannosyltransferase